jgi:acyl-coenzyme A thioesterase PaaI-like protein
VAKLVLEKVSGGETFDKFLTGIKLDKIDADNRNHLYFSLVLGPNLQGKDGKLLPGAISLLIDTTTSICLLSRGFLPGVSVDIHYSFDHGVNDQLEAHLKNGGEPPRLQVQSWITKGGRNMAFTEMLLFVDFGGTDGRKLLAHGSHTKFIGAAPPPLAVAFSLAHAFPTLALKVVQRVSARNSGIALSNSACDQRMLQAMNENLSDPLEKQDAHGPYLAKAWKVVKTFQNPYGAAHGAALASLMSHVAMELMSQHAPNAEMHSQAITYCSAAGSNALVECIATIPKYHTLDGCTICFVEARSKGKRETVLAKSRLTFVEQHNQGGSRL